MTADHLALSVIVPAYNERARVAGTLRALGHALADLAVSFEIRVVDDGSSDETAAIVERAAETDGRIVLQQESHRGKGAAVRAGMLASAGELRFMCDADLSMPPREIRRFIDAVPSAGDVAIASRELPGAVRIGEPHLRHWMGRGFNWLVRTTTLSGLQDTQCGFKMFSASAAEAIFTRVTTDGWAFDIEVLGIARQLDLRVIEIPVEWHYGVVSRVSPVRDTIGMTKELLAIRRRLRLQSRGTRPPKR
jgi:dolichyl-phosphate beta-glucosyltransferase